MPDPNQGRQSERQPLGERLDNFFKKTPALVLVLSVSGLVTAVSTLVGAVGLIAFWLKHPTWQSVEYERLSKLRAGVTLQKFEEQLGQPSYRSLHTAPGITGTTTESVFQRNGYWVDVMSDSSDTVQAYAVTACKDDFNPTFSYWDGTGNSRIVLNKTHVGEVRNGGPWAKISILNTAPSYVFEVLPDDDATDYKGHALGLNDVCHPFDNAAWVDWIDKHPPRGNNGIVVKQITALDKVGRNLIDSTTINTFAETANDTTMDIYSGPIGVSRSLVR
ncbi:ETEC_3214 domain-containing protein [Streptomyces sp. NPDC005727]|uniref:ETEC_3214 domain-containing protein n=1 Tax=Streptomyces sp. NPDC005727 TaxID=3157053 RepID=UPI003407501E